MQGLDLPAAAQNGREIRDAIHDGDGERKCRTEADHHNTHSDPGHYLTRAVRFFGQMEGAIEAAEHEEARQQSDHKAYPVWPPRLIDEGGPDEFVRSLGR